MKDHRVRELTKVICLLLLCSYSGFSQARLHNERLDSLVTQGIDLTWRQEYGRADSVFAVIIKDYPGHPAGYVYKAGVMETRAMDTEMEIDGTAFDELIKEAKVKARALLAQSESVAWGQFFLGTAEGYDSYARIYRGDWVGGTMRGLASRSAFKESLANDSTLQDAFAGIGAFDYWRSKRTEHFNWLPFLSDDRTDGITLLKRTLDFGVYNRMTALGMLIAIYLDAGSNDLAMQCSKEGLREYPDNTTFLWGLATAAQKSKDWAQAESAYARLLPALDRLHADNPYNQMVCRLNLARSALAAGDPVMARQAVDAVLMLAISDFPKRLEKRAAEQLRQARTVLSQLTASSSIKH